MGLEQELRREMRNSKLRMAILSIVALSGAIAVGMMAPNVLSVLGKIQKRWSARNVSSAVMRLREKGLLSVANGKVVLTPQGKRFLASHAPYVQKPRRWDRKWRIVIFDIPEHRKNLRDTLRNTLQRIGFLRLQHSVWVLPYDCEELVTLLKADYHLGKDVLYMIVDKIGRDKHMRARFGL
jgi:DNA-binding transcriptional regulator PaaX